HEYLDGPIFIPGKGHPHPITGEEAPVTLGHEFSGTVAALGEGVDDLEVGQHVVVEPYVIREEYWGKENYHLSPDQNFIGLAGNGGALAEQISVYRHWVHPIPDNIALDEAALIEPLAVAYHAFARYGAQAGDVALSGGAGPICRRPAADAKEGDVALIGGAGPRGRLSAAVAKAKGVTTVISELSEIRRKTATDTGVADYVFTPAEVDVVEEVQKLTDGAGADVAFEAAAV